MYWPSPVHIFLSAFLWTSRRNLNKAQEHHARWASLITQKSKVPPKNCKTQQRNAQTCKICKFTLFISFHHYSTVTSQTSHIRATRMRKNCMITMIERCQVLPTLLDRAKLQLTRSKWMQIDRNAAVDSDTNPCLISSDTIWMWRCRLVHVSIVPSTFYIALLDIEGRMRENIPQTGVNQILWSHFWEIFC